MSIVIIKNLRKT